ncbi:MAG: hypothetical protein HOI35_00755 [Woeseia sp.]|nr:hypothetical protein [Woeseia sp.]MBT6208537.1 hypothetical protein [Woeseia sp.]
MNRPERPRIVVGYGRSGTTWVLDVLAQANSLRPVFEPMHPDAIPAAAPYAHKYLARNDRDDDLCELLNRYFDSYFHSIWADYRIRTGWLKPRLRHLRSWPQAKAWVNRLNRSKTYYFRYRSQRLREERIVKLIRANMIISWLRENMAARMVFIVRHPAAVVLSQAASPQSWDPYRRLNLYKSDSRLSNAMSSRMRALLSQSLDSIEALTLAWCVENSIAFKQAAESDVPIIHYEDLLENGEAEWPRILAALDLEIMPDSDLIARPSQQTWGEQAKDPALVRRYESWMTRIDPKTAEKIQAILDEALVDVYNVTQALPVGRK